MKYAKDTRATTLSGNDTYRLTLKYNRLQVVVEEEAAAEVDEVQVPQIDEQQEEPYIEYVEEPEAMYWGQNDMQALQNDMQALRVVVEPPVPVVDVRIPPLPAPVPDVPVAAPPAVAGRSRRLQQIQHVMPLAQQQRRAVTMAMMQYVIRDKHDHDDGCSICRNDDIGQGYDLIEYYVCPNLHLVCPPCKARWIVQMAQACPVCRQATAYTEVFSQER